PRYVRWSRRTPPCPSSSSVGRASCLRYRVAATARSASMPRLTGLPRHIRPWPSMAELGPVTCAGCALFCDDVIVEASDEAVRLQPDCPLGAVWFSERLRPFDGPPAAINGEPADVE